MRLAGQLVGGLDEVVDAAFLQVGIRDLLDAMWNQPETLWWPFLGTDFASALSASYIALARTIAPSDPSMGSVNTTSAPNARRMRLRSGVTLLGTGGLTVVAFVTKKDFSFLRGILVWAGILAIVAIVGSVLFGFHLGTWFSVAMIGFAGAAILYDTSNVMHHYPEDRHVAAALELFASIALMFWYVLQLFMSRD